MSLNGKLLYAAPRFLGCLGLEIVMETQFLSPAGSVLPDPLWQALEETTDFLLPPFPAVPSPNFHEGNQVCFTCENIQVQTCVTPPGVAEILSGAGVHGVQECTEGSWWPVLVTCPCERHRDGLEQ